MSELKGACIIGQSGGPTSVINAVGQVLHCPADTPNPTQGQYGDLTMVDFSELRDHEACKNCKAIQDFWRFIEPAWKEM